MKGLGVGVRGQGHDMEDPIGIEKIVHGQRWGEFHNGYFSDLAILRPLVDAALRVLAESPADVVVDLGGGTGFLLSQLASKGIGAATTLINVDCSDVQLAFKDTVGIIRVHSSIGEFCRTDVAAVDQSFLLLMRSVLHYFGEDGLLPLLRHLRDKARKGEFFVHQSASFEAEKDAACLNALYRHMRTRKWYPTVNHLKNCLLKSGWRVTDTLEAPSLVLTSEDLGLRYALDARDIARIQDAMVDEFGGESRVFRLTPSGFQADLHYRIITCVATSP
jgi:SAM-dependent methyltransferase